MNVTFSSTSLTLTEFRQLMILGGETVNCVISSTVSHCHWCHIADCVTLSITTTSHLFC